MGQAIAVSVRFLNRARLTRDPQLDRPNSSQFRVIPLSPGHQSREVLGSQTYDVTTLDEVVIPLTHGTINWTPHQVTVFFETRDSRQNNFGIFGSVFGRQERRKRIATTGTTINVQPLPVQQPATFTGLVGEFTGALEIKERNVNVSDNIKLTISITGEGSLEGLAAPDLRLPKGIKAYSEKPTTKIAVIDGKVRGQAEIRYSLVASEPGKFDLGRTVLTYFKPSEKAFRELDLVLGEIEVRGEVDSGSGLASDGMKKGIVRSASNSQSSRVPDDILPIHASVQITRNQGVREQDVWKAVGVVCVGFFFWVLYWILSKFQLSAFVNYFKRTGGISQFKVGNRLARKYLGTGDVDQALATSHLNFKNYLCYKIQESPGDFARKQAVSILRLKGTRESLCRQVDSILLDFEKLVYGGETQKLDAVERIISQSSQTVQELEKSC